MAWNTLKLLNGNYDYGGGFIVKSDYKTSQTDADKLGLRNGDSVKVTSATCPDGVWKLGLQGTKEISGKIKVTEGMRPGVVGFSLGSGHFAYGSKDVTVDGNTIKGDARRGKGMQYNECMIQSIWGGVLWKKINWK